MIWQAAGIEAGVNELKQMSISIQEPFHKVKNIFIRDRESNERLP